MTCVRNDYGFDEVFSRYLEANGKQSDCLLAVSTSGKSSNILKAAAYTKSNGMKVIGLSDVVDSLLASHSDIYICTPTVNFAGKVQELHIKILHILIELIEYHFAQENYK